MTEAETLTSFLDAVWARLEDGAHGSGPGKLLMLATARPDGGASARMLILRGADRGAASLSLYTHAASAKVAELTADPRATLLLWDPDAQLQARLRVTIDIEAGDTGAWEDFGSGTRLNYARDPLPAEPIEAPDAIAPTPDASLFRRLDARLEMIDALTLATEPHRRARYHAHDGFTGEWIAP